MLLSTPAFRYHLQNMWRCRGSCCLGQAGNTLLFVKNSKWVVVITFLLFCASFLRDYRNRDCLWFICLFSIPKDQQTSTGTSWDAPIRRAEEKFLSGRAGKSEGTHLCFSTPCFKHNTVNSHWPTCTVDNEVEINIGLYWMQLISLLYCYMYINFLFDHKIKKLGSTVDSA